MTRFRRCAGAVRRCITMLVFAGFITGCALSPWRMEQVDQRVAQARSEALSCPPQQHDRCALDSPVLALAAHGIASGRHYLNLLEIGEDALAIRIHLIRAARKTIDLQSFILRPDQTGELILNELLDAARRGVKVRLLLDQMFSGADLDHLARLSMAHVNFTARFYNPSFNKARTDRRDWVSGVACCFSRFNQRMHNKALVVDGVISVIGGRNIADRYFDYDPIYNFKDRDVVIFGSTTREVAESFEVFWEGSRTIPIEHLRDVAKRLLEQPPVRSEPYLPPARLLPVLARAEDDAYLRQRFIDTVFEIEHLEYFSDLPRKQAYPEDAAKQDITVELYAVMWSAEQSVLVQTPYMVLSADARRLFRQLRERNPGIELVFATNSLASTDADSVYANTHKHKERYTRSLGFTMYELKPFPVDAPDFFPRWSQLIEEKKAGLRSRYAAPEDLSVIRIPAPRTGLHSKSFVVDGRIAMIGSHNFDPRSEGFNTENGLIVWDDEFAAAVEQFIRQDIAPGNSWVIAPRPSRDLEQSAAHARYQAALSYEPATYGATSAFELIPGKAQVPPGSPDFYANHYPVGSFPQVTRTRRQFMVLLLGSLFGFLEPVF